MCPPLVFIPFSVFRFLFSVIKIFNINKLATEFVAFEYELGIIHESSAHPQISNLNKEGQFRSAGVSPPVQDAWAP